MLELQTHYQLSNADTEDLQVLEEVHDLIHKTKLPVFVTPMGKGAVNETHAKYGGVYAGEGSQPEVKKRVEASDLILTIGAIKVDSSASCSSTIKTDTFLERFQHGWLFLQDIPA